MASIIVDLSDDIKKLQSLKKEIQEVKKELGSINVNVRLDIKRDMEAKLKSLTTQYDALVQKVSQAEGKIIASTQRINQAAEKIVKAQEQLAKATGTQQTGNAAGSTTAANQAETASVQAQAKAYDELADEIDAVMGTRSQNIRRMVEEQNAIRLINAEISKLNKYQGNNSTLSASQQRRLEQLNASLLQHKTALSELRQSLNNSFKLDNSAATSMNALSQSLGRMRMAYRELTEEERKSPFGQELLASIQQADAKIKQLDASIGNHQRNVGNYASGWNGLNMSVQQIVRELPAATMGLNMFFLAISNNLPILTDEIKRAREANEQLKKSGQSTVPVWKQLVSSIFSWQTAMMLAITAFSMYGKEIVAWVKNLFNAGNSLENLVDIQKEMNDVMSKGTKDAQGDVTRLNLLYNATQDVTRSTMERATAVEELQKKYPDYFGNMSKEEILAGKAADSYTRLSQAIIASARARAAQDKMTENASKILDNEQKINEAYKKLEPLQNKLEEAEKRLSTAEFVAQQSANGLSTSGTKTLSSSGNVSVQNAKSIRDELKRQVEDIENEIAGYRTAIRETNKLQQELAKSINIESLVFDPSGTGSGQQDESIDRLENYLNDLIKLRQDNEDRQIELMQDGTEKEVAEIKLRYSRIRDEVKSLEADLMKAQGGKLTKEQQITFSTAYSTIDMRESQDIGKTDGTEKRLRKEREAMNKYLQEYGTYQQKRLAITEEYQQKIAEATTEGDRMTLQKQMEEALKDLDFSQFKDSINFADIFGNLDAQTTDALKSLRDKLEEYINNAAKDLRPEDLKELQDAFKDLDFKIAERDPFGEFGKALDEYRDAQAEVAKAQQDLNAMMQGVTVVTGVYADETGKLVAKTLSQAQAEEKLNNAQKKRAETLANLTTTINSIGSQGSQLVNAGNELVGMLENLGVAVPEAVSSTLSGLGQVMNGLESIDITKPFSLITGAVSVFAGIGNTIAGWFGIGDKKNERQIQRLQEQAETLEKSYEKLGKEIEKAYSTDAAGLIEDQNKLLEQQKVLIQQQIAEEEDKKHTDSDRIEEWEQQLEEIDEELEENKEKAIEAITGTDVMSAIDEFAQAYADAWASGEDAAKASTDTVKKLIKTSLLEFLKKQLSPDVEEFMGKLAEYMSDGIIDSWEKAQLDRLAENMNNTAKNYYDQTSEYWKDEDTAKQQQSSRGYSITASQDSVDEINGRMTAMAESNYRIEDATQQQTLAITDIKGSIAGLTAQVQANYNVGDEVRTILAQSYIELQGINENTRAIVKPIQQMQKDIEEVKRNTSRL